MLDQHKSLDIEDFGHLDVYFRERAWLESNQSASYACLPGGVSNKTVLVTTSDGRAAVLKQALEKLRVATEWRSHPRRIKQEALGLRWLAELAPPDSITPLLFEDEERHLLAMVAVPQPHENWKMMLLAHGPASEHVAQFAELLAAIHSRSHARRSELAPVFEEREFFDTLRLEPYYRFTAAQVPAAARFYESLIAETWATRLCLVHGDYSPKNVLVHRHRLVLLDHEVIHFGDPTFDVGFSLTHLLSKANHLPHHREAFLSAARLYWERYHNAARGLAAVAGFEARAVRQTLGCLLARVAGRSPLEYLTAIARTRQRTIALRLIVNPPRTIPELLDEFESAMLALCP